MEHSIDAAPGIRLWAEDHGAPDAPPLLLIMGAQASGLGWPDGLVGLLATHHRVIRYDHRDTGRSTWSYDDQPYPLTTLADDALAVLDGLGVARAHVVGMSLGGMLTQLLIADHPDCLLSATLIGTAALSDTPYRHPDGTRTPPEDLPGIDPRILDLWSQPWTDEGQEAELVRRVTHWRLLSGGQLLFDADYFRALDRKVIAHTGHHRPGDAHGRADHSGMLRTEQLARTTVPTLVISAPAEPVFPLPHAHHLAQTIHGAHVVEIPGMGHALPPEIHKPLATAILDHTAHR
ncbi:alpha/beta fold hydrolase [Streptomyces cyaneochromogenes]|uniref:Alpha/beta fold hydrolase n=1 Tax=Streptomyces cyaneochromogenes TaxID=2496836 RepID=A0A3Q9EWB0_9ACTN|nr:alpha/beta hydrolase [Streptomyces cyaneochromogenes]AZQ36923.1 alpha/beta fold hydrolase [Streptomyces cyaneochromogenes]